MASSSIRFLDGAAYERYMGRWSRLAGGIFLDWLAPGAGLRWLDVGCGNGAFTEVLVERCAPASVLGLDPSPRQLAHARRRPSLQSAGLVLGDAIALPSRAAAFDLAVMPLVIFFIPDPAGSVGEMARVVRPGGEVAAYAWDMLGGGFPYHAVLEEMRGLDLPVPTLPSPGASRIEALRDLWADAGLEAIETRIITVQRTFEGFEEYWTTIGEAPSVGAVLAEMGREAAALLAERVKARLGAEASGSITGTAWANAVKGRVAA